MVRSVTDGGEEPMSTTTFRLAVSSVLALAAAIAAAEPHPFTVNDLVAMQRISDPQASPAGDRVAFVVTTMDLEANRGTSDLWLTTLEQGQARQLTTNPAGDWSPRWADENTMYFLSTRSGSSQVWRLSLQGGEAQQVTDLPLDVESLTLDPTGASLFLGLKVFPSCEDLACTTQRLAEREQRAASGRVYDRLFVRHWDTFSDGRRNHVFMVELDKRGLTAGAVRDLMQGVDADCPTIPWGGAEDLTVSPDGTWLVYTAKVVEGSEEAWSTDFDLWAVRTDGSEPATCLTEANPAWDAAPVFSPDGKTLAYLAMSRPGYESDRFRVVLYDWQSRTTRVIAQDWDRSPGGLVFSHDGKVLYADADNIGNHSLFRIDLATEQVSAVVTRHANRNPQPLPDGSLVFAQDSFSSPAELFHLPPNGGTPLQLTNLNDERCAEIQLGEYRQFSFHASHGDEVYGYLLRPVGFDRSKRYPLAFLIHGGPQGSFDDHWHYRWNPQIYAAHGYVTVTIDFHGSTGYGQAFTDAINGDWGGAPYQDLMTGIDFVLDRYSFIDPDRMVALGASFGGYMINWIQGNTDRFKALVCHDGNLDEYMAYFDTEELWFPEWDHDGTPWDNPEGYRKHSPVSLVERWKTPELVIHGARDYRVVVTQGLATFNALQRLGVPSRLLFFPDENHWVLKPQNSIQWHEEVLAWIDRWTAEE